MKHQIRSVTPLDGLWDFSFLGKTDPDAVQPAEVPLAEKALVPSAFDAMPSHAGKRGAAIYRRTVEIPPGRRARLEFGAVSIWCRVHVDGVLCGSHSCGYAPFTVDVPASDQAVRVISVLVDNRLDPERAPMHAPFFDFYQYGGILRSVFLHVLPEGAWMDSVRVAPAEDYRSGGVEVAVHFDGGVPAQVRLEMAFDGADPEILENVAVVDGVARWKCTVPSAKVWSPDSPHLHSLRVVLLDASGTGSDDAEVRFGLRRIEAREGALWLNGDVLKLRGVCRHEWHPNSGLSTPTIQMMADLQIIRGLGCNFIRCGHYPQDQRFLDLCDELGMLIWEENLGSGQGEEAFSHAKFRADHLQTTRAMVRASANHPSVIMWGFLNEAKIGGEFVRPVFEETIGLLRSLDPSRLVTFASNRPMNNPQFDLADVISINVYPGWYECDDAEEPLELIQPFLRQCFEAIDARGFGKKPVLVSEIGAEGIYGWHDAHNDFFTEEYQAEYLRRACLEAVENPRCSGISIWHFSDIRTYSGSRSMKRPRTYNNKGIFDEYRRPKAAAQAVAAVFQAAET